MLFAQAAVDATTTATGAAAVACTMTAVQALFSWLTRRDQLRSDRDAAKDKLEHDTRVVQQEAEIQSLKQQHAECEANHAELKAEIAQLSRRIDDLTGHWRPLPPSAA